MNESSSKNTPPLFEPPQACVNRIIKSVLPENVQVIETFSIKMNLLFIMRPYITGD